MNKSEQEWLSKLSKYPKQYKLVVDNDSIWIDDVSEEECVFSFSSYGEEFIVELMNYLGYNAEHC